jgi:hypothetical protein
MRNTWWTSGLVSARSLGGAACLTLALGCAAPEEGTRAAEPLAEAHEEFTTVGPGA